MNDNEPGVIQVIVPLSLRGWLERELESHGCYLFPIPVEGDLPTYGVGLHPEDED